MSTPTIHVERYVDDDECNPETYGRETGTDYIIGESKRKTWIHFPDELPRPDIQIQVMVGNEVFDVDKLPWAVPALNALMADPRVQAEVLRYLARQGEPIHTRTAAPSPPAPKPERPDWQDTPADFQHEIPIGEICGSIVCGRRMWEQRGGMIQNYAAVAELNGLTITAYPPCLGDERTYISVNTGEGLDSEGDIFWSDWGKLRELATDPSDPLGQLMTMARRFVAESVAEQRAA